VQPQATAASVPVLGRLDVGDRARGAGSCVFQTVPSALENFLGRVGATLVWVSGRDLGEVFDLWI